MTLSRNGLVLPLISQDANAKAHPIASQMDPNNTPKEQPQQPAAPQPTASQPVTPTGATPAVTQPAAPQPVANDASATPAAPQPVTPQPVAPAGATPAVTQPAAPQPVANDASATPAAPQPVPNDAPSAESAQPADDDLLGSLFSAEQPVASPHTADQAAAPPPTPEWRAAVISKFNQELGASYESEDQVISEVRQLRDQLGRINTLPGGDAFASAIIDRLKTGTIDDAMHLLHAVKADFLDFDPNAVVTEKVELEDGTESTKELPIGAFRHPLDDVLRAEAYYLYKDRFAENPTDPRFASLVELHIADSKKRLAGIVSPLVRQQEERRLRAAVQETHKAAISDLIKHTSEKANEVYKREQQARERINELVNGLGAPPSELWGQKLRPEVQKKMADSLIDRIKTDPVGYLLELVSVRQPDGSLAVSAEKLMMLEADYNPRHDKEGKGLRNKIIARSAQQMAAELAIKLTAQKVNIDPTKEPDKAPNAENVSNSQPFKVIASKKLS